MNQMYRSFASGTAYTAINPDLKPMTNFGQEVGFDFEWREFTLSGTYFNNNLQNFIDFLTVCNTSPTCAAPFIAAAVPERGQRYLPGHRDRRRLAAVSAAPAHGRLHQHHRLSHQLALSDAGS